MPQALKAVKNREGPCDVISPLLARLILSVALTRRRSSAGTIHGLSSFTVVFGAPVLPKFTFSRRVALGRVMFYTLLSWRPWVLARE
jgi:hypothetical protein